MNWHWLVGLEWSKVFLLDSSVLEMILRGTLTYLGLFAILRAFRRPTGQLGVADVLLITIIADAAQNSMGGNYQSVSSGFVLIATIVFWDRLIDYLSYRHDWFGRIAEAPPAVLIRDGRKYDANLRKYRIGDDELASRLREHGLEHVKDVHLCMLEGDGRISVIERGAP